MDGREYLILSESGSRDVIATALLYIREHCSEDITLSDAACTAWMSPAYFSRLFVKTTGIRFSVYLRRCRLEKARALLTSTSHSVKEIAAKAGFRSAAYFIKLFSAEYGMTPGQCRRASLRD